MPQPAPKKTERSWDEVLQDIQRAWADAYQTDRQCELPTPQPVSQPPLELAATGRPQGC